MAKLELLKPKVKCLAEQLIGECGKNGIKIIISETRRSIGKQNELYAQGRTKPGEVVTNAKGGYSFHNYGVAFDFCPVVKNKAVWENVKLFETIGAIGESIGLEWGGRWKKVIDRPHFQYTLGYTIDDFRKGSVDWHKFA